MAKRIGRCKISQITWLCSKCGQELTKENKGTDDTCKVCIEKHKKWLEGQFNLLKRVLSEFADVINIIPKSIKYDKIKEKWDNDKYISVWKGKTEVTFMDNEFIKGEMIFNVTVSSNREYFYANLEANYDIGQIDVDMEWYNGRWIIKEDDYEYS